MELQFLGTGAGVPAKHRNVSSVALKLLDERNAVWLFDCGEGTQQQILHTSIRPRKIEKIFITHLHGDHIFGLPGLLSSRSFQDGTTPVAIYGPKGVETFVKTAMRISGTRLGYPIQYVEVPENGGVIFKDEQFTVETLPLAHGIASFGYRIIEADHEGELQAEKLKSLGVKPGPIYGKIKRGEQVTLPDGTVINGKDFVGAKRRGRIVTILGDTRKTPNSIKLGLNADVIVHESTYRKDEAQMAHARFHSTSKQAAEVAADANAKQLVLTHISSRYLAKEAQELEKEARAHFEATILAKDFDVIEIPFHEEEEK